VLVATGQAATGTTKNTEIIDLESPTTTCKNLPDFPSAVIGGTGGLGFEDLPIICGGSDASTSNTKKCYSFNESEWISSPDMLSVKTNAAVSLSPNLTLARNLFVTGGQIPSSSLSLVEVLGPNGWETLPQSLPVKIYFHCSVLVNSTTVMIIGGVQNDVGSPNTYYFNTVTQLWNSG
jgi:hypothetical protein